MRTHLLLVLALVAALLIWFIGIRADASDSIAPLPSVDTASSDGALVLPCAEVVAPSASSDRVVPVLGTDDVANLSGTPTLLLVRVTAVETDDPVEHIRINAWGEKTLLVLGSQALETDEEGFVEMEVEPGFALIVIAQGDGRTTGNAQVHIEALKPGESRSIALAIVTRPDLVLHGIVLQRDTREAISGVVVEPESLLPSGPIRGAVTGNDGRFQLALRSFAIAALRYEHPEFATALSPARAGHDRLETPLEILLDRAASIRVLVATKRGESTSAWTLTATAQAADLVQPGDGRDIGVAPLEWFARADTRLERLPPKVRLYVEIRDGARVAWRAAEPIVLSPGEERLLEGDVGFGSLSGFVREADDEPARNVEIAIVPAALEGNRRILGSPPLDVMTTSLDDGSYRFDEIPLGSWFVFPAGETGFSPHGRRTLVPLAERFEIRHDGDRVVHDIVLVRGLSIVGRVVDATGNGVVRAAVHGRHESILGNVEVLTAPDGSFELHPLSPGTWMLGAAAGGAFPVETVPVAAGAHDVVLTLDGGLRLIVEVHDELDAPVRDAIVNVHAADGSGSSYGYTTDASGTVIHTNFIPAAVHVAVTTPDGRFASMRDLVVVPGRETRLRLRVEHGGRARLRFDGPGASAHVLVHDRQLVVYMGTIASGREIDITGPIGEVEVQLTVKGKLQERTIALEREPRTTVVFDGSWK